MLFLTASRPFLEPRHYKIAELAELLVVTPEALLDAACDGELRVFVRVPEGVGIYSVHADAIDLGDEAEWVMRHLQRLPPPDELEAVPIKMDCPNPQESLPLSMDAFGIRGLFLSKAACQLVRQQPGFRHYLFPAGLKVRMNWLDVMWPIQGHFSFRDRRTLSSAGWCLACYQDDIQISFRSGVGYSKPHGIEIGVDDLYATSVDIEEFIESIDVQMMVKEFIEDGHVRLDDLPDYFSKKLVYLLAANQRIWHSIDPADQVRISEKLQKVDEFISSMDFQVLCEKERASRTLMDAAKQFITPLYARKNARKELLNAWPTYLTPELMALMVASRKVWGASTVCIRDGSTHPYRPDIEQLMRRLNFGVHTSSACTIIHPERAPTTRQPVPQDDLQAKVMHFRSRTPK